MSAAEKKSGERPPAPPDGEKQGAETPHEVRLSRREYEALTGRVKELEEMREKMLRTAADFENAKKRLAREREDYVKFGQEKLIRELLPVLDNFERALAHLGEDGQTSAEKMANVRAGVEMILKRFCDILKSEGLAKMETAGQAFNPHVHEAVAYVHEDGPEDMIVDEIEPGYLLHGRLLRAAKVRVRISPARPDPVAAPPEITGTQGKEGPDPDGPSE